MTIQKAISILSSRVDNRAQCDLLKDDELYDAMTLAIHYMIRENDNWYMPLLQ